MTRLSTFVAAAAVVSLVGPFQTASGQSLPTRSPEPVIGPIARAGTGSIRGLVMDGGGVPAAGAMVSALGATAAFAMTDRDGRFLMKALPPGPYTVRVHLEGFLPSRREIVEVRSAVSAVMAVALESIRTGDGAAGPKIMAAGFSPGGSSPSAPSNRDGKAEKVSDTDDNHSDVAWRLRHLTRSVFRTADLPLDLAGDALGPERSPYAGVASRTAGRLAASPFGAFPFSGTVNLVTTGSLDATPRPTTFASRSVAYLALGVPVGSFADVLVRGAYTEGDVASWFVAGSLSARQSSRHRYGAGASYSSQRYEWSDPLAFATVTGGARAVGSVHGFDEWMVSKQVTLGVGLNYAWYDYLAGSGLLSPRVALTLTPLDRFRVKTTFSRRRSAPGAEELLPPSGDGHGLWLPPERTFSALPSAGGFRPETTSHYEVGVERDVESFVLGFRAFYQHVSDQLAALFGNSAGAPTAGIGHYYVSNVGDLETTGWAVSLSRPIVGLIRGSVDYSLTTAYWRPAAGEAATALAGGLLRRPEQERFHDVTTTVETTIPQTATRVYVFYKLNTAFARPVDAAGRTGYGLDGRFDIQLNQGLPFLNFTSAEWEILLAVRNVFRDAAGERSAYDEILVVRPPNRIVGGVRVRF
jgi:hypothetical protein